MKIPAFFFGILIACSSPALAAPADYHHLFDVNLDQPLPALEELQKKFQTPESYFRYYDYTWNIGQTFDLAVNKLITSYGTSEKRLKTKNEDALLDMLNTMPKESWQYIGPYLHLVPGMSPKILNLPGIKETKNRFPDRIAPQLQNIEGLEFLSPSLYFVLMPEAWPENLKNIERPQIKLPVPKAPYNPQFFATLEKVVPFEDYKADQPQTNKITRSDFRTVKPAKNSLVTLADMQAVGKTLEDVAAIDPQGDMLIDLYHAGRLIDAWESEHGVGVAVPVIKDLANPCSRLVQKMRLLGQEQKLALAVSKQGFTTTEWGYTCDKTIRAFRASQISNSTMLSIMGYQRNANSQELSKLPPRVAHRQELVMQSVLEIYNAPFADILEARKYHNELAAIIKKLNNILLGTPLRVLD